MTQQRLETVKVQDGKGGYIVKNKSDMGPDDQEFDEKQAKKSQQSGSGKQSQQEQEDFSTKTKAELLEALDKAGVEYESGALKDDLVSLAEKNRDKLK